MSERAQVERTDVDGVVAVRLVAATSPLSATFVPGAGMVGVSLRDGDDELLGQRGHLAAYVRDGKTMGIPLLHPWANRLAGDAYRAGGAGGELVELKADAPYLRRDPQGLPIHGLLAASPFWALEPAGDGSDADGAPVDLAATLDFGAHPELLASFPFPHRLRLAIALRERTLTLRTTLTATGVVAVPVSFGFHPYLQLPGVPREAWRVELPAMEHLRMDPRGIPTGEREPVAATALTLGTRAFDDGYVGVEPDARFSLAGGGRRLTVRFEHGYAAAQVFAPPGEELIAIEPMTAPANALVSGDGLASVAPGRSFTASFSITVAPDLRPG
ncbi:MAG: Aldose 1-epimerase [Conexibacter sp.]|nr:Aldose 1-epimerase [Conexibacter sp.]